MGAVNLLGSWHSGGGSLSRVREAGCVVCPVAPSGALVARSRLSSARDVVCARGASVGCLREGRRSVGPRLPVIVSSQFMSFPYSCGLRRRPRVRPARHGARSVHGGCVSRH